MRMACTIRVSPLALFLFASANAFLASLHSSVNHGANVLPHLLGFLGYLMADLFRKSVIVGSASAFIHFKHCNGSWLRPVLLFALKCDCSTCFTSVVVILALCILSGTTKLSADMFSS